VAKPRSAGEAYKNIKECLEKVQRRNAKLVKGLKNGLRRQVIEVGLDNTG